MPAFTFRKIDGNPSTPFTRYERSDWTRYEVAVDGAVVGHVSRHHKRCSNGYYWRNSRTPHTSKNRADAARFLVTTY